MAEDINIESPTWFTERMAEISKKTWSVIGWTSMFLIAVAIPYALVDGAMSIFVLYAALMLGGLSGLGLRATCGFGVATITSSLLVVIVATHYTGATGLRPLQFGLVFSAFRILAWPVFFSAVLLLAGAVRRRAAFA